MRPTLAIAGSKQDTLDLQAFLYLQVLDAVSTLIGLRIGAFEASPFIGWLMQWGPAAGVVISKLIAVALAALCLLAGKRHIIRWISYWYAALVLWNLGVLLIGITHPGH